MTPLTTAQLQAVLAARQPIAGATLAGIDWADLAAEDASFTDCTFPEAQFAGTSFAGARFLRCTFPRARFVRADLTDATFESCGFVAQGDRPEGCTLSLATLRNTSFTACDLSLARIERSDLFNIQMDQCTLRGARLHKLDFSHAYSRKHIATRATLRHCTFELAELSGLALPGADLTGSRFREADLSNTDLTGAILRDADLFQAILANARLANADLRGADISGLALPALATHAGLKITQSQQHVLLESLGIDVHPDPG